LSLTVSVLVGNPRADSKTKRVGELLGRGVASALGGDRDTDVDVEMIDLALLGPRLFDADDDQINAHSETIAGSAVAIVASPVYKASFTGLLKAFLDRYGFDGLQGVVGVPLMVGASSSHALALDCSLRPLLVELGATVPVRGLFLAEGDLSTAAEVVTKWCASAAPILGACVDANRSAHGSEPER
jgi:FMN reductase